MTQQSFLGLRIRLADTLFSRLRGFLGRHDLAKDEGLWIVPSRGIHTIGLMFPTDIVYLDEVCRVIHIVEGLQPFRIAPLKTQAQSVLELPARTILASRTRIGDRLLICSPDALKSRWQEERRILEEMLSE